MSEMDTIAELIWDYGQLSPEERANVDSYIEAHPEYKPFLAESKTLYRLIEEAGLFAQGAPHDVALACLIADNLMVEEPLPEILQRSYERLKKKVDTMPHVKERYNEIRLRMEKIASNTDPVSQFENLSGYDLELDFAESQQEDSAPQRTRIRMKDRSSVARTRIVWPSLTGRQWSFVATAVVLVFSVTWFSNRVARNAYTDPEVLLVNGYNQGTRGLDSFSKPVSSDILFLFGQRALYEAQHKWLGLYVSYDEEELVRSEEFFTQVIEDPNVSSFIKEEAMYLLGKVYMAQKNSTSARSILEDIVELRSRRSEEASTLLDVLE